ncbi:ATP-binding protein [Methanobrevibacter olleyae]|uniref:ATPase n=1 Tax=Methanobrevibacter olleyae TaxID=294671 RepID=A0A126R2D2_METOL|nr:DUF4143 domain-containing protein [Methanobrevibacter olleyae]AMK15805.1 ATPase [Methanobrevibacter olleyae]SFL19568.1 hypothetical protein SAMN02910297_00173 [Methanobrevibacter olleyae]
MGEVYIHRIIDKEIQRYLKVVGAILIVGPKWCGKTTTAEQHAKSVLKLDDIDKREEYLMLADIKPSELLNGEKPRLIDEWQIAPILWDGVRNSVDSLKEKGLYLLTGSTSVDESEIIHSGTGRIHRMKMYPMSLYESGDSNGKISIMELFDNPNKDINGIKSNLNFDDLLFAICRGGWPESLSLKSKEDQLLIPKMYVDSICESDVSKVDGVKRDPEKVRHLLKSYARNISTEAKDTTLMADISEQFGDISRGTFYSYVDALKRIYVIENVQAWSPNIRSAKTMRSTTKKEFIDPSIAISALNLTPQKLLTEIKTLGFIFETLCIRDLKIYTSAYGGKIHYFRKNDKLEVDCVLILDDGRYALIEFKLGAKNIDEGAKHLIDVNELIKKERKKGNTKINNPEFLAVITGGEKAYTREDGVKIIPIACLKN